MPSKNNKRKPSVGKQAEKSIFKAALDQVQGFGKARYGGKAGMSNIVKDVMMLKNMINTENKVLDQVSGGVTITTSGLEVVIVAPAEGTDNNQRTGRSIKLDRLDAFLLFRYNSGTAGTVSTQIYRWFAVKWINTPVSGASGGFPLSSFLNLDASSLTTVMSLPNTDTAEDFRILAQGTVTLQCQSAVQQVQQLVEVSIPLTFHQTFNGTTAGTIVESQIQFVFLCNTAAPAGGENTVVASYRTWFIDN